jgi:tRNA A37 threonylcarbamoyladenosine biosynthesis protein TsaE
VHHADLYRLRGDGDEEELGLQELPGPHGVLAVEWSERLRHTPWSHVFRVSLEHAGEDLRRIEVHETSA